MTRHTLSVVIPAYNAAADIGHTIQTLVAALERAPAFEPEIVVVDDGSSDGTGDLARQACGDRFPLTVLTQSNQGRFRARQAGLDLAQGEWALLLDSRVELDPDALAYVAERIDARENVWNAHVIVVDNDNPFGIFWRLLAELAWPAYFADPRPTSYGIEDFDLYPKGTTCFLARRELLVAAVGAFNTRYEDARLANDDTPVIRWIAQRERIHLSPQFTCMYQPRTTLAGFARHAVHRGTVFLDGHAHKSSRYLPAIVAFYPLSGALAWATLRRPLVAPVALATVGLAAALFASRRCRTGREQVAMSIATPIYAVGHGAGMWKGLCLLALNRLRQ